MAARTEFKKLTRRTQSLLVRQESADADFKKTLASVEAGDLVAFANSSAGGVILIGVDETEDADGLQRGEIVGCKVGDQARLALLNKSQDCTPPVQIEVIAENISTDTPILRVEIPSERNRYRPYCTKKGEYRTRRDGRNAALMPDELLGIYMEVEGEKFRKRFRTATERIEADVESMRHRIESQLEGMFSTTAEGRDLADEAMAYSDEALAMILQVADAVSKVSPELVDLREQVEAILAHFEIADPIEVRRQEWRTLGLYFYFRSRLKEEDGLTLEGLLEDI